jgi:hypothetical protein
MVWIQSHELIFVLEFTDASICLCRFQDISHYQFHVKLACTVIALRIMFYTASEFSVCQSWIW